MYKAKTLTLIVCSLGIVGITLTKVLYPQLTYFNSGLPLVILLTIFLKRDLYTKIFGGLSICLILSPLLFTGTTLSRVTIVEQVLAAAVAFVTTVVVLQIKRLNLSIETERIRMNALFEHATEGIILINSNDEIVLANPELQRLFKYELHELLGKPGVMLIPDRFRDPYIGKHLDYSNTPAGRNLENGKDLYGLKKTGEEFPVQVSISYFQQLHESFAVAFITDISQRKESENKLIEQKRQLEKITFDIRKMNTELENKVAERTLILQEALQELERSQMDLSEALNKEIQLNEIKSRFVSMASHEFRTPLSTVLSSAALLSKYQLTEDQEKREKHTRRIKESVKHLNDLLEDFLSLGKLEEGRVSTNVSHFELNEFLYDVIEEMKSGLRPGQHFKASFEGVDHFVTDKRLLKNVLINLLSNSIKFSDEGKPISIIVKNLASQLLIQVKDEGIGIAKDDMPFLFTTFYRGKNVSNIQGTGLGLHIIKRYVDLLEGQISFASELNQGTVFSVDLPCLKEAVSS